MLFCFSIFEVIGYFVAYVHCIVRYMGVAMIFAVSLICLCNSAFVCFSAKNLILAGVKSITLHDDGLVELWDLSSSFVFSEEDVGKNRALASLTKLQELNNSVIISTLTGELTKEQLSDYQVNH